MGANEDRLVVVAVAYDPWVIDRGPKLTLLDNDIDRPHVADINLLSALTGFDIEEI